MNALRRSRHGRQTVHAGLRWATPPTAALERQSARPRACSPSKYAFDGELTIASLLFIAPATLEWRSV